MTTHLVTFASNDMSRSSELCVDSVRGQRVVWAMIYNPAQVDVLAFPFPTLRELMKQPRGVGYWAWKPFIIAETMKALKDEDVLIYSDAGVEFLDNVNHIIDRMDQDIFLFGNMYEHAHWCKRDIVEAVFSADNLPDFTHWALPVPWEFFSKQVQASVIFFRVNDTTRAFVKEWLDWCLFEGGRLIDDSPSRAPNHPEFQENRHDQAILTTMAYREGIKLHWWPASYNDGAFIYERGDYPDEGYPVLFHHHRRRQADWAAIDFKNAAVFGEPGRGVRMKGFVHD